MSDVEQSSLEQLEGDFWGDAPAGATRLMTTVHELRRRPVASLGVEDLRILVGQQVGIGVLLPLALARLESDPLAEGDFYPGDLLAAVLRVPAGHWRAHPGEAARLRAVVDGIDPKEVDEHLGEDISAFRSSGY